MSSVANFFKQCANCPSYKWPQPDNVDKRCAGCKILHYCSKECQTEHWLKVHKFHCKYLSGSKVMKDSSHKSSSCRRCQSEIIIGSETMAKEEVSVLGCPFSKEETCVLPLRYGLDLEAPSPVKLGEITGIFPSKVEHTVSSMQRLIYKMSLMEQYKMEGVQKIIEELSLELLNMRMVTHVCYCFSAPRELDSGRFFLTTDNFVSLISSLQKILNKERLGNNGKVKLMDTLLLLCQLLKTVLFKTIPVPNAFTAGAYVEVTEPEIFGKWERVLQKLDSDDWTYNQLISILLPNDKSSHRCFGCGNAVNARSAGFWEDVFNAGFGDDGPKFYFTTALPIGFFLCQFSISSPCSRKMIILYNYYFASEKTERQKNAALRNYWCDTCFKASGSLHRCSACLTKLYCGPVCRDEDWTIHKQVCMKDDRKKKEGKIDRVNSVNEEDNKRISECFKKANQMATDPSIQFI